jgi:hypothetical protein
MYTDVLTEKTKCITKDLLAFFFLWQSLMEKPTHVHFYVYIYHTKHMFS